MIPLLQAGDRRRVPVSLDPRVQGVRRGLPAHVRRARHVDRARQPASLQGVLRAEPAGLRRPALARRHRGDRRVPARRAARPGGGERADERRRNAAQDAVAPLPLRRRAADGSGLALVALALFAIIGPFLWILTASFKYQIAIYSGQFPFTPTLSNYADVLFGRRSDFAANIGNSMLVAAMQHGRWCSSSARSPRIRCAASAGPRG